MEKTVRRNVWRLRLAARGILCVTHSHQHGLHAHDFLSRRLDDVTETLRQVAAQTLQAEQGRAGAGGRGGCQDTGFLEGSGEGVRSEGRLEGRVRRSF